MTGFTLAKVAEFIGIRGGIAIALAVALGVSLWRADSLSEARDDERKARVTEQAKHAVTRASLEALQGKLDAFVLDGQLRAESRDTALAEVKQETAKLRDQAAKFDITTAEGL